MYSAPWRDLIPELSRASSKKMYPVTSPMRMASRMAAIMPIGSRYVTLKVRSVNTTSCLKKVACSASLVGFRLRGKAATSEGGLGYRSRLSVFHAAFNASTRAVVSASSSGVRLSMADMSITNSAGLTKGEA